MLIFHFILLYSDVTCSFKQRLQSVKYICYGECDKSRDYVYSPAIMYNSRSYWGM